MTWTRSPSARLLFWCIAGAAIAQAVIARAGAGNPDHFSRIFWLLLTAFDTHGNLVLAALVVCAFFLRRHPAAMAAVRFASERPWGVAAALFPLLCLGSLRVYHDHPLAMDEYAVLFQAQVFAAGHVAGIFPADLVDRLIPNIFHGHFFSVSRPTGAASSVYLPGFSLLLAPFAWLDIPWAANPAIGALTIPAIHRLALQVTDSRQGAGWAVLITVASPVFIISSISYYSMPAHLLCNLLYALLLTRPSVPRAMLAGLVGSLALTLHNPAPHLLFCFAFVAWLCVRPGSAAILGALVLGYLPLSLMLGAGWQQHVSDLAPMAGATPGAAQATSAVERSLLDTISMRLGAFLQLPQAAVVHARIAGLSKVWTWAAPGAMVLAALGFWAARTSTSGRLLGAALAITFIGYFFVPFDQGHGWGYRYLHSAWFVIPVLASIALSRAQGSPGDDLRNMCAWALGLSLLFANGLRLVQVESFIHQHLGQVPPLAQAPARDRPEVVFVNMSTGLYTQDLVQNDPFLRSPRVVMTYESRGSAAAVMAKHYPAYIKAAEGRWGELWTGAPAAPREK